MAVAVVSEMSAVDRFLSQVPRWWSARAAAAGLEPEWCDIEAAFPGIVFGREDVTGIALPGDPYAVGERYVELLSPQTRLREGRHYTPVALVDVLWDELDAAGARNDVTFDPAAGAGALLLPFVRRLATAGRDPRRTLRGIAETIHGVDLDPVAVDVGNVVLGAELLRLWARLPPAEREPLPRLLHVDDGLRVARSSGVVVMNPPYGRIRLDGEERIRWRDGLYGHANRYGLFLQAAFEQVDEGGYVGAIVPTSLLGGSYFQRLRALIGRRAPLRRIVLVEDRAGVFVGGVLQETCLAVFEKGGSPQPVACTRLRMNGAVEPIALGEVALDQSDRPWLLPRSRAAVPLVRTARTLRHTLADFGWHAATGPLVWNRHKARIGARRVDGVTPIVWAADLDDGRVRPDPARRALRYIRLREQDRFMALAAPAVLVQRTTAPEQTRRLVVATLDDETLSRWGGEVVIENHVNVLRCTRADGPLTPQLLAKLLRTTTFDALFRCISGSVAVSSYELAALPLPDGETLERWSIMTDEELDDSVRRLYGRADS